MPEMGSLVVFGVPLEENRSASKRTPSKVTAVDEPALMAYTKLPAISPELELLELEELLELDEELEELEDELEELEELLEDPAGGGVCEPPQAAKRVINDRGSKCRIFKVEPSKIVRFSNRYCEPGRYFPGRGHLPITRFNKCYRNTNMIREFVLTV